MRQKLGLIGVCIAAILVVIPVYAHHPFSAEYDANKPVTLTGTVTKVDWSNPHAYIHMDVKGQDGKMANWTMELGNPKKLQDAGWKKDSVKMGDQVTVEGWQARDGSNRANANTVTMPDGKKLAAGSSYNDSKKEKRISN